MPWWLMFIIAAVISSKCDDHMQKDSTSYGYQEQIHDTRTQNDLSRTTHTTHIYIYTNIYIYYAELSTALFPVRNGRINSSMRN